MRIPGVVRLKKYGRRLLDVLGSGGIILAYHQIKKPGLDPWGLRVSPQNFASHLELIRHVGKPVTLGQLTQALKEGKSTKGLIALTFDDGYADNYENAKPLLQKYDIPATVFVISGAVGNQQGCWPDQLAETILGPKHLPALLELHILGKTHRFELGQATVYTTAQRARDYALRVWQAKPETRLHFYYLLWKLLQALAPTEQTALLKQIAAWANHPFSEDLRQSMLSNEQLASIGETSLIEIGGHTLNHARLPQHSVSDQRKEITADKTALQNRVGRPITSFAYPYGAYNTATVDLVKEAGYSCACTVRIGRISTRTDPYLLRRYEVGNWDGEELYRRLFKFVRH